MGYHVIDPADVEVTPDRPSETRFISDAAGLENMGLRTYRVEPGEEVPLTGMHYHDHQEEVFYVEAGELHVETPDGEFVAPAGTFFIAEPESPHRAYNPADAEEDLQMVAIGAPSVDDGHPYEG